MTLGEYIGNLQQLVIDNPALEEMEVIYQVEEAYFKPVEYAPTVGRYLCLNQNFDEDSNEINSVCIN